MLPLPFSALKSAWPVLGNPFNRSKAITLTQEQFDYGWGNALSKEESKKLYETYHVAGPGVALMQMANANLNPFTEATADSKNPERGPMLIIEGEKDHTVPWAIAHAAYKRQKRNPAVTEIVKIPNRGHSLTIDSGWQEVAQTALDFLRRTTSPSPRTPAARRGSDRYSRLTARQHASAVARSCFGVSSSPPAASRTAGPRPSS